MQPEVEFFSEDVEGVEYLNVGFKFTDVGGNDQLCVLGAFTGEVSQEGMGIIKGLVEQAAVYILEQDQKMLGLFDESPPKVDSTKLHIVGGGSSGLEG